MAVAVYDKSSSFDPQSDPIVRVEAGRLRSRLSEFYAGDGIRDELKIELPRGTYIPVFKARNIEQGMVPIESIAVIPFDDHQEPDLTYLVHGLCEAVTRRLAQILQARVAPWSMILRAENGMHDLAQRARVTLNVRTLLTLRLAVQGDSYELHAEWLDPVAKSHLWGAQYSRRLAELFGLEDDISFDLAGRFNRGPGKTLVTQERRPITSNGRAYQLYLRARHLWNKRTADAMDKATEYYRRAIGLDSSFALAFAGLADCYLTLASFAFIPSNEGLPLAKVAASRALEIDAKLGEAKTVLACLSALYEWNWPRAQREFEEAMLLSTLYPVARQWYGACLCARHEFHAGRKLLRSALELDPLSPMIGTQLAVGLYLERRYADAILQCNLVLENDPHFWAALLFRGLCQVALGQLEAGIHSLKAATDFSSDATMAIAALGHGLAAFNRQEALALFAQLVSRADCEYVPSFWLALLCCGLGEREEALGYLERARDERSPALPFWLAVEPRLDPVRPEMRFQRLLQEVGLTDLGHKFASSDLLS